jgi:hypothetical protein
MMRRRARVRLRYAQARGGGRKRVLQPRREPLRLGGPRARLLCPRVAQRHKRAARECS